MKDGFVTMNFKTTTPSHFGEVTAGFHSIDPAHATPHSGIDFAVPTGTEIHAPTDGIVSAVKDYGHNNLGKSVFVKMDDGQQYAVGHLSKIDVHTGDKIHHGDLLGLSGNTGNSTGPHLHFGLYDKAGHHIDPGNVSFEAFSGQPELVQNIPHHGVTIPNNWVHHSDLATAATHHGVSTWYNDVADKVINSEVHAIFAPIGEVMAEGLKMAALTSLEYLPLILTIGGMCCFIITMALGKGKFYGWGLASWAVSALVRVISHGFGI